MKLTALIAGILAMSTLAISQPQNGGLVEVTGDDLFIPVGFDDNDEAVLVVDGFLPSGCYRLTRPEVDFDQDNGVVTVRPMARWFDIPCIEARIPYNFEVRLGVMPMGEYEVRIAGTDVSGELYVEEAANAGPDDYLYAPVDAVTVERLVGSQTHVGLLEGRFTNSCMRFDNVRVIHTEKTVQVLPIIEMDEGQDCLQGIFPFKQSFIIPADVEEGRHLLHVRSLNGRDVNKLFTITRN